MRLDKERRYLRFLGPRPDADVEDEIAFHLEMRAKEFMARGMEPAAAREEARRRFGDRARVEADMRRMERERARRATRLGSLRDWRGDLTFVVRSLVRQPLFSIAVILTLGLSIGANTAIFSAVSAFLLKPMAVRDADQMIVVATSSKKEHLIGNVSYPLYREVAKLPVFDGAVSWLGWEVALRTDGEGERGFLIGASGNYLTLLGVQAAYGRVFTPQDAAVRAPVLVLNDRYWERKFSRDPAAIGRVIHVNDVPFTVIGVLPPSFTGTQPLILPDLIMPVDAMSLFSPDMTKHLEDTGWGSFRIIARLKSGVTVQQARLAVTQLGDELARQYPDDFVDTRLVMEREIRTRPEFTIAHLTPWIAGVFFAMVGLALLVACANVTNLLLARATARRSEIAVRSALGAAPGRVIRLLLTESVVLGAVSLVVAFFLARFCIHWLNNLPLAVDVPVSFGLSLDWRVFSYAAGISLIAGVLAGLAPAVLGARTPVNEVLREGGRTGTPGKPRARLRSALVVAQVAVSFVLLVSSGLFMRSARSAAQLDLGFSRERLLLALSDLSLHRMDLARSRVVQDQLLERMAAVPSVERIALGTLLPMAGNYNTRNIILDERPAVAPDGALSAGFAAVTPGFLSALGHKLLGGRDFTPRDDSAAPPVAIINQVLAEAIWPGQEAVGRHFRLYADSGAVEVVGVMNNAQYILLGEQPRLMAYYPLRQHPSRQTFILIRTKGQDPSAVTPELRRVMAEIDPKILVYGVRTMAAHLDHGIALFFVNIGATLATVIGMLALLQTIVGLYGVLSYSVAQRSREFGIRIALGAAAGDVIRGVVRQGSVLVGIGLIAGAALAFALTRMMGSLLVGVSSTDALVYAGSILIIGLLALLSSFIPAWRASRVAPASAMRAE